MVVSSKFWRAQSLCLGQLFSESYPARYVAMHDNFLDDAVLKGIDLSEQPAHLRPQAEITQLRFRARRSFVIQPYIDHHVRLRIKADFTVDDRQVQN